MAKLIVKLTGAGLFLTLFFSIATSCSNSGSFTRGPDTKSPTAASTTDTGTNTSGGVDTGNVAGGSGGTTTPGTTPTPTGRPSGQCVKGDKVTFSWPTDIQSCMSSNKVYNFVAKTCTNVGQATSFTCDFDSLYAAAKATLGKGQNPGDPTPIMDAKNKGALLIACGQKSGTDIIIAQWYYPSTTTQIDDCNFAANNPLVISACYRFYPDNNQPPDTSDPKVLEQRVQDCLNL